VKTRPHIIRHLIKLTLWVPCVLFLGSAGFDPQGLRIQINAG